MEHGARERDAEVRLEVLMVVPPSVATRSPGATPSVAQRAREPPGADGEVAECVAMQRLVRAARDDFAPRNTRSACRKIAGSVSGKSIISPCMARDCSSALEFVDSRYCSSPPRRTVLSLQ